jgi:hypothetical protein
VGLHVDTTWKMHELVVRMGGVSAIGGRDLSFWFTSRVFGAVVPGEFAFVEFYD